MDEEDNLVGYIVTIVETLEYEVYIEAENENEACEIAEETFHEEGTLWSAFTEVLNVKVAE